MNLEQAIQLEREYHPLGTRQDLYKLIYQSCLGNGHMITNEEDSYDLLIKEWKEAVGLLGGNSFHYWFKVAIPSLLPSILGTFSVLFANSLAAYGTAYALLSNNISLLPIRISQQFVGEVVQNQEFGCALSLVMMALMVISVLITNKLQKKSGGVQ